MTFTDRQLVLTLMAVAAVLYSVAAKLRLAERPWGDEPHYLVMSIALGKYHTFDLTSAYANRDYDAFYPTVLDQHVYPGPHGMVPLHNWGGPILWALPFELWGRAGAAAVVVLAGILTVGVTYRLLRDLGIVRSYAALTVALFVVGSPLYMYASMQFIEPFGALGVAYAARVLVCARPTRLQVVLASAGLGWLPWVHGRFLLFTLVFGLLLVLRVDRAGVTGRRAVAAYLPAALPVLALFLALELFNVTQYGTLAPSPGNANIGDGLLQLPPQTGLAGLLFDRQFGLLSHFPLLALAVPGMLLAFRRRSQLQAHLMLLAAIVPYIGAVSTFRAWFAGFAPPGRLLMVLTPLLAFYVAVTLQRLHQVLPLVAAVLATATGFGYSMLGDIHPQDRFVENRLGIDPVLARIAARAHHPGLPPMLPAVRADQGHGIHGAYVSWYLALAAFTAAVWLWGLRTPAGRVPDRPLPALVPTARALLTRRGRSDRRGTGS